MLWFGQKALLEKLEKRVAQLQTDLLWERFDKEELRKSYDSLLKRLNLEEVFEDRSEYGRIFRSHNETTKRSREVNFVRIQQHQHKVPDSICTCGCKVYPDGKP